MAVQLRVGDKIWTPSRFGSVIQHYGIFIGWRDGVRMVVHNAKSGGVELVTFDVFSAGQPVYIEQRAQAGFEEAVVERALSYLGTPYDLFTFNCEHFATEAQGEARTSKQLVKGAIGVGVAAVVLPAIWAALTDDRKWDRRLGQYRDSRGRFAGT